MNKKSLSERDICSKFINPAIVKAGWDFRRQVREEFFFTDGRIIVQGRLHTRGKRKRADYLLFYKPGVPIAIIEAKDNNHHAGDGMQQKSQVEQLMKSCLREVLVGSYSEESGKIPMAAEPGVGYGKTK